MKNIKLKNYQIEAVEKIKGSLKNGKNKMAIIMASGSGKTEVAIAVIKGNLASWVYRNINHPEVKKLAKLYSFKKNLLYLLMKDYLI